MLTTSCNWSSGAELFIFIFFYTPPHLLTNKKQNAIKNWESLTLDNPAKYIHACFRFGTVIEKN